MRLDRLEKRVRHNERVLILVLGLGVMVNGFLLVKYWQLAEAIAK